MGQGGHWALSLKVGGLGGEGQERSTAPLLAAAEPAVSTPEMPQEGKLNLCRMPLLAQVPSRAGLIGARLPTALVWEPQSETEEEAALPRDN